MHHYFQARRMYLTIWLLSMFSAGNLIGPVNLHQEKMMNSYVVKQVVTEIIEDYRKIMKTGDSLHDIPIQDPFTHPDPLSTLHEGPFYRLLTRTFNLVLPGLSTFRLANLVVAKENPSDITVTLHYPKLFATGKMRVEVVLFSLPWIEDTEFEVQINDLIMHGTFRFNISEAVGAYGRVVLEHVVMDTTEGTVVVNLHNHSVAVIVRNLGNLIKPLYRPYRIKMEQQFEDCLLRHIIGLNLTPLFNKVLRNSIHETGCVKRASVTPDQGETSVNEYCIRPFVN